MNDPWQCNSGTAGVFEEFIHLLLPL